MIKFKKHYNLKILTLLIAIVFCLNTSVYGINLSYKAHLRPPMAGAEKVKEALNEVADFPPELKEIKLKDNSQENFNAILEEMKVAAYDLFMGKEIGLRPILESAGKVNPAIKEYFKEDYLKAGDFHGFGRLQRVLNAKVFIPDNRFFTIDFPTQIDHGGGAIFLACKAKITKWHKEDYLDNTIWIADIEWEGLKPDSSVVFNSNQYVFLDSKGDQEHFSRMYEEIFPLHEYLRGLIDTSRIDRKDFTELWSRLSERYQIRVGKDKLFASLISNEAPMDVDLKICAENILRPRAINSALNFERAAKTAIFLGGLIDVMEFYIKEDNFYMAYVTFLFSIDDLYFYEEPFFILEESFKKRGIYSEDDFFKFISNNAASLEGGQSRAKEALNFIKSIYEENFWPDEERRAFLERRKIGSRLTPHAIVGAIFEGTDKRLLTEILLSLKGKPDAQKKLLEDVSIDFENRRDLTNLNIDSMMNAVMAVFNEESLKKINFVSEKDFSQYRDRLDKLKFLPAQLEREYLIWSNETFVMTHEDVERLVATVFIIVTDKNDRYIDSLKEVFPFILEDLEEADENLSRLFTKEVLFLSNPYLYRIFARRIPKSVIIGPLRKTLNRILYSTKEIADGGPLTLSMMGVMTLMQVNPADREKYDYILQVLADHNIKTEGFYPDAAITIYPDTIFSIPISNYYTYISEGLSDSIRDKDAGYDKERIKSLASQYKSRTFLDLKPLFIANDILDNPIGFIESWTEFDKPDFYILVQDDKEIRKIEKLKEIGLIPEEGKVFSVSDSGEVKRKLALIGFKKSIPESFTGCYDSIKFSPLEKDELLNWRKPFVKLIERILEDEELKEDLLTFKDIAVGTKVLKDLKNRYDNFRQTLESL